MPAAWDDPLLQIVIRYSTNRDYRPYDLIEELEKRHLFQKIGDQFTDPVAFEQSIQDRIEAMHAQISLSRDSMTADMVEDFHQEIEWLLSPYTHHGKITLQVMGHIVWGRPLIPT